MIEFRLTNRLPVPMAAGLPSFATRTPWYELLNVFIVIVTGPTKVGVENVRMPEPRF